MAENRDGNKLNLKPCGTCIGVRGGMRRLTDEVIYSATKERIKPFNPTG